jgi:hypothetical protein
VTTGATAEHTAQLQRLGAVRARLARSPIVRSGGVLRTRLLDPDRLATLAEDARASHAGATESRRDVASDERGDPDRWLESAPGGSALQAFASSDAVLARLVRATGVPWQPAGPGSWSYYRREGHYLGLHRDLSVCDLAVITCVVDRGARASSGTLRVWPTRARDSLDGVRQDPTGGVDVRVEAGETVFLLGGLVPHCVTPLESARVRIVAPLCYQAVPCDC